MTTATAEVQEQAGLKVGTEVAYRLGTNGEWLAGTITNVDQRNVPLEEPYEENTVHLLVKVDRRRHYAAVPVVLRLNVHRGPNRGQWLPSKPKGADEQFKKDQAELEMRNQIGRQLMRGETPAEALVAEEE